MDTVVRKWGNSLALRIPRALARDIRLRQGSAVEVSLDQGRMVVRPKGTRRPSLARMLKSITPGNLHNETDWGAPMGRESW